MIRIGKYPIGIQDFREIRIGGYTYIDKTEQIYQLLDTGKYYFLSRPRRFGKSLLLSTIEHLYQGERSLFEGLWIERHWDWSRKYPVVHIKMSRSDYQRLGLEQALLNEVERAAVRLGIELRRVTLKERFEELLALGSKQGQVVLLVDEYDKPMIDYLSSLDRLEENRFILKQFYSIIKDSDSYLRFFLLTGVSRFSKVSIFSDLNNLKDISIHPHYNSLVGISQLDVEQYFEERLQKIAKEQDKPYETLLLDVKAWYNGYSFGGKERLYNPFSLLNFMQDGYFGNYWFHTGTPTFLVARMKATNQFTIDEHQYVPLLSLSSFDERLRNIKSILFQTGYLTLKEINFEKNWCKLQYPNKEVQASLEQFLIDSYRYEYEEGGLPLVIQMSEALNSKDVEEVISIINSVFSTIPYDLWRGASELHYHALVHLTFSLLGNYVQSEVHSSRGRCDAVVQTKHQVYAFEFKLDKSVAEAMAQLEERGYLNPYQHTDKELIGIGINFSSEAKQVEGWEMKVYGL